MWCDDKVFFEGKFANENYARLTVNGYSGEEIIPKFYMKINFYEISINFESSFATFLLKFPEIFKCIVDQSFIHEIIDLTTCSKLEQSIIQRLAYLIDCKLIYKDFFGWHKNLVE